MVMVKTYNISILPQKKRLKAKEGENLFHFLDRQGYPVPSACGGMGTCGKCRVLLSEGARAPTESERVHLTEAQLGDYTIKRLKEMQERYEIIGDVRGKGLAICIELVKNRKTKEPIDSKEFIGRMFKKGVLMVSGGVGVRIFPPLIISKEIMDAGLEILESTIKEINEEYCKL